MAAKKKVAVQVSIARVLIYKDKAEEWRWTAFAQNGEKVADSGEGYRNRLYVKKIVSAMWPDAEIEWGRR